MGELSEPARGGTHRGRGRVSYRLRAAAARWLLRLGRVRGLRWALGAVRIVVGAGGRRTLQLRPAAQLEPLPGVAGGWRALGVDPSFVSRDLYALIPKGWCHLDARLSAPEGTRAVVYVDSGHGFAPDAAIELPVDELEGVKGRIRVPASTRAIRLDPLEQPGEFRLGSVELVQASAAVQLIEAVRALRRRSRAVLRPLARAARWLAVVAVVRPARWLGRAIGGVVAVGLRRSALRDVPLEPEKQLAPVPGHPGRWHSLGSDPRFRVAAERLPRGWCEVSTGLEANGGESAPCFYAQHRGGREIRLEQSAWLSEPDRVSVLVYLPLGVRALSWRPREMPGEFRQEPTLTLEPLGPIGRMRTRARLGPGT